MTFPGIWYPPFNKICFTPEKDAYVAEYYPNTNFGDRYYLFSNLFQGCDDEYQSLIKFDLCNPDCNHIPPNSFILEACLHLWVYRNEVPQNETTDLCAYPVVQYWDEQGVTWNTRPNYDDTTSFCTAVCPGDVDQWIGINVTELVRDWYKGFRVNDGILLKCDECFDSVLGFYSKEYEDSRYWPYLCIRYGVKCCVPRCPRIDGGRDDADE